MAKQMNCPRCMIYLGETVKMNPTKDDFYRCPVCGGEFWPGRNDSGMALNDISQSNNSYVSMSMQPGEHVVGGGGSTGRAKKSGKKKTLAQINASLSSEYHKS